MPGPNPSVEQIVKEWLITNGYTGLFQDECGCPVNDLFICGEVNGECEAGYQQLCKPEDCRSDEDGGCQLECDGYKEGNWVITRTKEGR